MLCFFYLYFLTESAQVKPFFMYTSFSLTNRAAVYVYMFCFISFLTFNTLWSLFNLRYLDIFLGLLLFLSMLGLLYGCYSHSRVSITIFPLFSSSIARWNWIRIKTQITNQQRLKDIIGDIQEDHRLSIMKVSKYHNWSYVCPIIGWQWRLT